MVLWCHWLYLQHLIYIPGSVNHTKVIFFSFQNSLTLAHDPGTSDDSGRASERLTTSSVAPRDADSSRDRLSDVCSYFIPFYSKACMTHKYGSVSPICVFWHKIYFCLYKIYIKMRPNWNAFAFQQWNIVTGKYISFNYPYSIL